MSLAIRMVLYLIGGVLMGFGVANFDAQAGTLTFNLYQIADMISGTTAVVGGGGLYLATFGFSRLAKQWGWTT